ncbi:hypothetical protein BKA70DRAFT_1235793 [Coprinopsis sp. MPI-PUGE-AT-0042]|nr:hypothetical protein BKA70DRAFT_1235793 [Coprinopsis sp. MPI-PUGE-AT-0042]
MNHNHRQQPQSVKRARFKREPSVKPSIITHSDASVDTSDLFAADTSDCFAADTSDLVTATEPTAQPPSLTLIQGTIPIFERPFIEHLQALSFESPRRQAHKKAVEPGPSERETTTEGASTGASKRRPTGRSATRLREQSLRRIEVPFVREAPSFVAEGTRFHVVSVGKVVGIFSDTKFVLKIQAPDVTDLWFSEYADASRMYNIIKSKARIRIVRVAGDELVYGPAKEAIISPLCFDSSSSPLHTMSHKRELPSLIARSDSSESESKRLKKTSDIMQPGNRSAFRFATGSSTTKRTTRTTLLKRDDDGHQSRKQTRRTKEVESTSSSKKAATPGPSQISVNSDAVTNGQGLTSSNVQSDMPILEATEGHRTIADVEGSKAQGKKRDRNYENWTKLKDWIPRRQLFLDELLRHDGLGDFLDQQACSSCSTQTPTLYKCKECWDRSMLKWNGQFFEKSSLHALGLWFQLGHSGGRCERSVAGPSNFTVFHTTGVHKVNVRFCDCRTVDRLCQLLRARWFPSTHDRTQTVFTFDAIEQFQELMLQGKTTLYDYYHTLIRLTDNMRLDKIPGRCNDFHNIIRYWRSLLQGKRSGRGQDPAGINNTAEGELALECPACPHPGKNIPDDWTEAGPLLFIYTLFLAMDANFKLKGKDCKLTDLEMTPGWSYCVNEHKYQQHLLEFADEAEISTCHSEHDAIVRASVRRTPGYNVTGAGLVICSRHGLVRPNGIGDLQKGETFANMDYIFFAAILIVALLRIVITYDIACQWSKKLQSRMERLPDHLKRMDDIDIHAAIPSWHINAHGPDCQVNFALMYKEGNGRTCGDEIEVYAKWDLALATKTLNDHFGGYNFQKIVGLHLISEWVAAIDAWNADHRQPNPYEEKPLSTSMSQSMMYVLNCQNGMPKRHDTGVIVSEVSPSSCLVTGLELEETQRLLVHDLSSLGDKATAKERADLQDRITSWNRRVQTWRETQLMYMPCAAQLLPAEPVIDPSSVQLILPSALSPSLRATVPKLVDIELRLRIAQADDALADIRRQRQLITGLWTFKKLNLSGQGNRPNTRIRAIHTRMISKTDQLADQYRAAYSALLLLETDPNATWRSCFQHLAQKDVRGPGREDGESGGRHTASWIWLVPSSTASEDVGQQDFNSTLRVEWCRSRARKERWCEEYLILQEEMQRTVTYLLWKSTWWDSRARLREATQANSSILSGVQGYALKQAWLQRQLASACVRYWSKPLSSMGIAITWPSISEEGEASSIAETGRDLDGGSDTEDEDEEDVLGEVVLEQDSCVFTDDGDN